jgi:hypothetical protein
MKPRQPQGLPAGRPSVCAFALDAWNFPRAINAGEGGIALTRAAAPRPSEVTVYQDNRRRRGTTLPHASISTRWSAMSATALDWCQNKRRSLTVLFGGIGSPDRMIVASAGLKPVVLKLHAGVAERKARNAAMPFFASTSGRLRCSAE